jgi:UDP-glucose 4-epimerase
VSKGRAVVFGGSGFIGSHVADALDDAGWSVTVFDIKESPYLRESMEMVVGDILDDSAVAAVLQGAKIVYNFAGVADVEDASQRPLDTIRYNILGNAMLLEALKGSRIERFVYASTLYVYSDAGSFYRDSKTASELYIHDYGAQYGIPFTILRFGSIYGPRSYHQDRIYKFVAQALAEKRLTYGGDGAEIREYIHVADAARCAVEILDSDTYLGQNVILSGHQSMRIRDLMVMISEIIDKEMPIEFLGGRDAIHYEVTPYSFTPRLGKKYMSGSYVDLGEGIMQCAQDVYQVLLADREIAP